ncbi:MAG: alpha-glucosidase family protein [Pseudomonadota bacterium]
MSAEPWWKGAVIYQIYPRSFLDTNGDGVGDLKGIIQGLDHIADLGVDGVWISPFFTSPMRDYGYDVADYCDVDPIFGTLDDFDALVAKARRLNLKIVIDQVYSHTSDEHAWFAESRSDRANPKADWYVWADAKPDGTPPSNWQSVFGGPAWRWDSRRKQYYMHNFLASQPQLNVHNREVQDALLAAAQFWLDRGVDGFRLDAINFSMHNPALTDNPSSHAPMESVTRPFDFQRHIHNQSHPDIVNFLERLRALMDAHGGGFTVAEVGGPAPIHEMRAFTEGEARLNSAYNFDFLYAKTLTPEAVRRSVSQWSGADGEGWPSWAFSNHDAPRAVSRWASAEMRDRAARLHTLLLAAMRGNVFLYQGEELGLPQADVPFEHLKDPEAIANWPETLGRDGARTPMPWEAAAANAGFSTGDAWLPVDEAHSELAVDRQAGVEGSCLEFTKSVLVFRQASAALKLGDLTFLQAPDGVLAFERRAGGELVLCVFNLSEGAVNWSPMSIEGFELFMTWEGISEAGLSLPKTLEPFSGYWARPKT